MQFLPEPATGQDPPYGVAINYWTNSDKDSVKIYVTSMAGDTLKTFKQKGKSGINRVWWDFQGKSTKDILMRTTPQGADWVPLDKNRTRPAHISNQFKTFVMPPAKYNVSMVSGDQKLSSTITVMKDPNSEGSLDDIKSQIELLTKMHADYDRGGKMVNELESVRRQLYDLRDVLKSKVKYKKVVKAANDLDSLLLSVEGKLVQLKYTGTGQDDVRYPEMLIGKIGYLANAVATADFPPTDQHKEVYAKLKTELDEQQVAFDKVMGGAFTSFLKQLDDNKIPAIVSDWKK